MDIPDPDSFGESGPKPFERIDSDEFHSLFEWDQREDSHKLNVGYCPLTGHYFPDLEPGEDCPNCSGTLEPLPDIKEET